MNHISAFLKTLLSSLRDLLPIILVVAFFQIVVIRQPVADLGEILFGTLLVILGLAFFIRGLEQALFPIGESVAYAFARKANLFWLLIFAFALGFGTTIAEPALTAVAAEAAKIAAADGHIAEEKVAMANYALGLRLTVAVAVGVAILLGVVIMTFFAPAEIIGIAYDSGGVTTSTVTVPLVTALGVGLASSIKGRNPMIDGFGLIAFASLTPMIFVMGYGMVI